MIVTLKLAKISLIGFLLKKGGLGVETLDRAANAVSRKRSMTPPGAPRHIVACDIMPGQVIHRISTTNVN